MLTGFIFFFNRKVHKGFHKDCIRSAQGLLYLPRLASRVDQDPLDAETSSTRAAGLVQLTFINFLLLMKVYK